MENKKVLNIKIVLAFVIGMMVSSLSICMAVNVISSKNVTYENTQSHLEANNVQDAVDELYNHATDYSEIKEYFQNSPTSYFDGKTLKIGASSTDTSANPGLILQKNDSSRAARFVYNSSEDTTYLDSYNSSGSVGRGTLNLRGDSVKINGSNMNKTETVNCSLNSSVVSSGTIQCRVKNGIAQVFGSNIVLKASGNSQTLATGLPKAVIQTQTNLAGSAASTTAQISAAGDVVWIQGNNTTLLMHAGSTYNLGHWFTLTYIVADS